ncbi:hypothetical protein PGTUg99_023941 [Puccinia graminis f. sp. tritici]|uniref:Uncharacterized protein n=1 Tax=Puccinia graminis f. sp. tritici TaxID=56615 RepID=A0A5B0PKB6_PUCGR|nr:hypothetical protein PGTUg99_023941 [Puccinia graminis f. sp. tritici]
MNFNDPLFGDDGDPTASYCPEEEDESPAHSTPLPSSQHSPVSQKSPKRVRQTSEESEDEHDIVCDTNAQSDFSRLPPSTSMDKVCSALQSLYHLDDEHDQIARKASKCPTPERHANVMYGLLATQQHQSSIESSVPFGDTFKTFVRTNARMSFLIPTLEAYSNNPNKSGALPKSLYYISLDAVDKQPDEWRDDNLPPKQLKGESAALKLYTQVVGELLKHQRSHLRVLILTNILETKRIAITGPVPNRYALVTLIYSDLPPENRKWTEEQIKNRVESNWLMRIRMAYLRLVLVYFYTHPSSTGTQWGVIDQRLSILRKSTSEFQTMYDKELFSHGKQFHTIPKDQFSIPSVDDVNTALAQKDSTREMQALDAPDFPNLTKSLRAVDPMACRRDLRAMCHPRDMRIRRLVGHRFKTDLAHPFLNHFRPGLDGCDGLALAHPSISSSTFCSKWLLFKAAIAVLTDPDYAVWV